MAHTKQKGSSKLGRDSQSKRLGVKLFGSQKVKTGQIIIRQRGTKYLPGKNTKLGNDHTIFSLKDGFIKFTKVGKTTFTGKVVSKQLVEVTATKKK
jgi:large subunit ribosomal protein L27